MLGTPAGLHGWRPTAGPLPSRWGATLSPPLRTFPHVWFNQVMTHNTWTYETETEINRVNWSAPRPPAPNGSTPAGIDWGVTIYTRKTWPQDGSCFAGITYETKMVYQGPSPEYRDHVLIHHSNYPVTV